MHESGSGFIQALSAIKELGEESFRRLDIAVADWTDGLLFVFLGKLNVVVVALFVQNWNITVVDIEHFDLFVALATCKCGHIIVHLKLHVTERTLHGLRRLSLSINVFAFNDAGNFL